MWILRIPAYCLMPNHYHLLVQTPNANIARCMRHIGVYTQRFNARHRSEEVLGKVCVNAVSQTIPSLLADDTKRPAIAFCLAWLQVAGGGYLGGKAGPDQAGRVNFKE